MTGHGEILIIYFIKRIRVVSASVTVYVYTAFAKVVLGRDLETFSVTLLWKEICCENSVIYFSQFSPSLSILFSSLCFFSCSTNISTVHCEITLNSSPGLLTKKNWQHRFMLDLLLWGIRSSQYSESQ